MNLIKFFILITLVHSVSFSEEISFQRFMPKINKVVEVPLVRSSGVLVSKACLVKVSKKPCLALAALKNMPLENRSLARVPLLGHPAAKFCQRYGAINLIFIDKNRNENDFCVFSDDSAINSWDLYNAHQ